MNAYVESRAPWKLFKEPSHADLLDAVLYGLCESLRIMAILISPVCRGRRTEFFDQLNWKMELSGKEERFSLEDAEVGEIAGWTCGRQTGAAVSTDRDFRVSARVSRVGFGVAPKQASRQNETFNSCVLH